MQRTVSLSTAVLIAIVVGIISYTLGSDYGTTGTPRDCEPCNGSSAQILTIRRTDAMPDFTVHIDSEQTSSSKFMDFAITNHSSSTTYDIKVFYLFPGIRNDHAPAFIRNINVFHDATLIARLDELPYSSAQVSTSTPLLIPPGASQNFSIFGRVVGSYPTSTAQVAIGNIYAVPTGESSSTSPETVYKESNGVPLAPPASTPDESLESAVFLIP
ncbi:MAG: hypothetical protein HYY10_03900 [Candidatus Liptonbacteria bacterium]|nr:hypothetical protein [Candidatus Liptonbacteria bacterium]